MQELAKFFNPVLAWFANRAEAVPEPPSQEEPLYQLDRLLQVYVRHPGRPGDTVRLMTERVGVRCLMFRSAHKLAAGQQLSVQLLLRPDLFLTVPGTVAWTVDSEAGIAGQLDLEVPEKQRPDLLAFLRGRGRPVAPGELARRSTVMGRPRGKAAPAAAIRYKLPLPASPSPKPAGARLSRIPLCPDDSSADYSRSPDLERVCNQATVAPGDLWLSVGRLLDDLLPEDAAYRVVQVIRGRSGPQLQVVLAGGAPGQAGSAHSLAGLLFTAWEGNSTLLLRDAEKGLWVVAAPVEARGELFLIHAWGHAASGPEPRKIRLSVGLLARSLSRPSR